MKAVEISKPGGPEVLVLVDRPVPELKPGEVLIKVSAAGINRPDVFQRKGNYPPPAGASDLPGLEVVGEIVSGETGDTGLAIGDKVCALVAGGGYAERSEEHTSELQSLMRSSYAVFCLKKKK